MSSIISSTAFNKLQYEVVWCCPATRSLIRHEPRPARFKDVKTARAFIKTLGAVPAGTFVLIRNAPVEGTVTPAQNAKLLTAGTEAPETYKWEVVGRSPQDYTLTHMVCDGTPLGFSDRAAAQACADFVNQFPYSVRKGLNVDVVPWKAARQWQHGLATELNEVV